MDFRFTPEQQMIKTVVSQFASEVCEPRAEEIDKTGEFPMDSFKAMAECGITGLGFPAEYGGSGEDKLAEVIAVEEIAKVCATQAAMLSIHGVTPWLINRFGNKDQKAAYLPRLLAGGELGAFALTEPGAGSDASRVQTTAVADGDDYILNGTKCFITGGGIASIYTIIAQTDPAKGLKGLTAFIVEGDTPGFEIGKIEDKMGIKGSQTAELIFTDVRVPKANILGKMGKGFKYAMMVLDSARIGTAAQGLGIAQGALELSIQYAKERVQFGKPIANLQGIQWYLAEMKTKLESARWMTYRAADLENRGESFTTEAAMAKLHASEVAREVTNLALQIHGGYGYMKDYPLERMYRDAKITEIYEGTSEIMKVVIASNILK
ncbi:MAG: acryloyl-CoA reductase [Eubacterium aggregans]|uniref:Acyl-CoA dehydrogenase n=1 Tax=Eubacterium aggregans TaxID=81409 RepID=A0A1H4AV50_9FIRM|nr:acryloyl-CoA reductase [Eubacterium aggregans]MDD4690963.1 acyl-CoA dehydrogenase family protein [Eubacterium aggregans]MEA5073928.1 acryloyl-CoA reductase [Eubacterium aggregans]SEA39730.1 Acyl-CoA dehydrogenase [Eubacterium aggregans]